MRPDPGLAASSPRRGLRLAAIPVALLLAVPALPWAQDRARPPPPSTPTTEPKPSTPPTTSEPAQASPSRPPRPPPPKADADRPPPPASGHPTPPGPGPGPAGPPPPATSPPPFWWGFGWGFGYYPLYPEPGPAYAVPAAPEQMMTARVTVAFGSGDSAALGVAADLGSGRFHFDLAADVLSPSRGGVMTEDVWSAEQPYGLAAVHGVYLLLEGPFYGLNLQAGGSWLSVPASASGAQSDALGLDLGAAAHVGLIGPVGLEGHARITPFPVQIVDLRAATAFRVSQLSLLVGYRVIDVAADSRTGPAARFQGWEVGVGLTL